MANYVINKTITAATTEATAVTQEISVTQGILKRVRIRFFKGAEETTYVKIFHQNRQILPSSDDQSYRGDDEVVPVECFLPIGVPQKILLKAWNVDASNDHEVTIELEIDPTGPSVSSAPAVRTDAFVAFGW